MPRPPGPRGPRSAGAVAGPATAALLELWSLVSTAARLWRRSFWAVGAWFCLGSAVHTLGLLLSARLGAEHGALALVAFVVGVVATLVALVLMIHSVEPHLRTASAPPPPSGRSSPSTRSGGSSVTRCASSSRATTPSRAWVGRSASRSVRARRWRFYALAAGSAWVARQHRGRDQPAHWN